MNGLLVAAALIAFAMGVAHSYLGERYILMRLFRRDNLPRLFGSDWLAKRTLRFAWHATTVAWWGFGALLLLGAAPGSALTETAVLRVIAVTFLASAAVSIAGARGRHLSWIAFLAIAVLAWVASG